MTKSWACAIAGLLIVGGCSSTTTSSSSDDGGGGGGDSSTHDSGHTDGGTLVDAGGSDSAAGDSAATLTGCLALLQCENACTTQACLTMCASMATTSAKALFKTLTDCIDQACPSTPGGVCAGNPPPAACDACVMASQDPPSDAGGTASMCYQADQACAADTP